jgi:hypothetical protein
MYECEDYEDFYQVGYQEEQDIITVKANVCDFIDYPDESVNLLKCDAFYEDK